MSIEVQQLRKVYGDQIAVNDISFRAGQGEILGFLGPNGAGKSTTMKILTGYLAASGGKAFVGGIDVQENPLAARRKIGYLPEQNALYYDMYVREYLRFMADVHQVPAPREAVEKVIGLVGLTPEAHKKTGQLSKGYKQRVGLAAALLHDPEVLILDEPTSGLDPNQITEIRDVIRRLGQTKTVLFSSHILQEVEALCQRVIILNKGRLVADSSLVDLRARAGTGALLQVEIREKPDASLLASLPGVERVAETGEGHYTLFTRDAESLRKQLLQESLNRGWTLVSLQSEQQSLEEIFRALTASA